MVTPQYSKMPSGATAAEIQQAHSLIQRGKTYAAQGDPKMMRIIKSLESMGARSSEQMIAQRVAQEEAEAKAKIITKQEAEEQKAEVSPFMKLIQPVDTSKLFTPKKQRVVETPYVSTRDSTITPYRQSYIKSISGVFGALGRNIKQFFTGRTHEYEDPLAEFEYAGSLKKDLPTPTPRFGTVVKGEEAFITYGEMQEEIDIGRTFGLDMGRIDIEGLYERTGTGVQKFAPFVLDVSGYVVAGAVGGGLGIAGYGSFRGSQLAAKGQYKDIHAGMEKYPGIAELSPESKAAGLHFGMAAYGGYRAVWGIGAEITALRIEEGMAARGISMPRIISRKGDDVFRVITRAGRRTPFFEADTKTTFDVFKVGDKTFQIGTGTGKTTVRVLEFMKEGTGAYPWRTATQSFTIMGRGGESILINAPENIRAFTGRVVVGLDKGFTGVRFGGVSRPVGERSWVGVGGEIEKVRLYGIGRRTVLVSPKDLVFGKDISFVDAGVSKQWGWTGGGKRSSKQFFEQLYKPDVVLDISGQATLTAQKVTIAPVVKVFDPSAYIGGGMIVDTIQRTKQTTVQISSPLLMERQILRERQGFFMPTIIRGMTMLITMPTQRQYFTPMTIQKLGTKQIQRQRMKTYQITPTITPTELGFPPRPPPSFKIPIIPWLPSGRIGIALGSRMLPAKQLFRYTPSFAGYTWGIKAEKISTPRFGKFTGLEIRPMVNGGIVKLRI